MKSNFQRFIDKLRGKKEKPHSVHNLVKCGFQYKHNIWRHSSGLQFYHSKGIEFILHEIFIEKCYDFDCKAQCIVFDFGMNRAIAALYFAQKNNVVKVFGYEPFLPTYEMAMASLKLNPDFSGKVETFSIGLSNKNEVQNIKFNEQFTGLMSTNNVSHNLEYGDKCTLQKVELRRASEIVRPIMEQHEGFRVVLKIDTEGSEFDILQDLDDAELLGRIDVVMLEYHFKAPDEIEDRLRKNGFTILVSKMDNENDSIGIINAIKSDLC